MNERIKELMPDAYELVRKRHKGYFTQELLLEYMAELVIKECADYVQFYYKDHACEGIAYDMKNHFGVER